MYRYAYLFHALCPSGTSFFKRNVNKESGSSLSNNEHHTNGKTTVFFQCYEVNITVLNWRLHIPVSKIYTLFVWKISKKYLFIEKQSSVTCVTVAWASGETLWLESRYRYRCFLTCRLKSSIERQMLLMYMLFNSFVYYPLELSSCTHTTIRSTPINTTHSTERNLTGNYKQSILQDKKWWQEGGRHASLLSWRRSVVYGRRVHSVDHGRSWLVDGSAVVRCGAPGTLELPPLSLHWWIRAQANGAHSLRGWCCMNSSSTCTLVCTK